jgi:O-antigen/teichoic acid export membrane protein
MTARFLGTERFGLWLLLGSFLTWAGLVDLGLGNSLTTEVARADGRDDREAARVLVASAFLPVLGIAVAVSLLFAAIYPWVPWASIMNVSGSTASAESGKAVAVTAIIFVARLPLGIAPRIYSAYQEGYRYQIWSGVAVPLSLVSLYAAITCNASLPILLASFFGTSLLGDVMAFWDAFVRRRRWLAPRLKYFDMPTARSLLRTGLMFWIAQIAGILLLQTDLVVVTRLFGAKAVAEYGVALRLFSLVSLVQMAFTSSLWPAYAEALERQDQAWVRRALIRSIIIAIGWAVLASISLVVFGGPLVRLLIAGHTSPSQGLLAAMATTAVVTAIAQSFAMLLNGLGEIRVQAWLGFLSGVFNVAVSVVLGHLIGPVGVPLGTTVAIVVSFAAGAGYLRKKVRALEMKPSAYSKGAM